MGCKLYIALLFVHFFETSGEGIKLWAAYVHTCVRGCLNNGSYFELIIDFDSCQHPKLNFDSFRICAESICLIRVKTLFWLRP